MDGRLRDQEAAERLGRNLFMARRRAGFSQEELGAMACLHRTEIGMVENGTRLPRVDTLIKLAAALDVRPEKLLEGIEWIVPAPVWSGGFVVQSEG
jgi:transcriptional regulator with XRE-family HTH domain